MEEERISLIDSDDQLDLYSYAKCTNEDDEYVKKHRGVIKNKNGEILYYSLPYTNEYTVDTLYNDIKLEEYDIYHSIEGTLIRVFHHNEKWYITTNRKLDAFSSYWSSQESFGKIFVNALCTIYPNNVNMILETFLNNLEKENIYFFLLKSTNENRIVCHINSPYVYYIGHYKKDNQEKVCNFESELIEFPRIEKLENLNSTEELYDYVETKINPFEYQGLIMFHKTKNIQLKILNKEYVSYWKLRNNNPNLYIRYLELRQTEDLEKFIQLYPKFVVISDRIENHIIEITKKIYEAYIDRFIKKKYVSLPKYEYLILRKAHEWHVQNRTQNKIYRNKILTIINSENPLNLYQILFKKRREK